MSDTARCSAWPTRRTDTMTAMLEVRIDETASADAATRVRLDEFDGPLGLLLSLIEARRLDVLTGPLGARGGGPRGGPPAPPRRPGGEVSGRRGPPPPS